MEPVELTFNEWLEIAKRRKWSFVIPAGLILLLAGALALLLPSIYKSTSTILIEEQEIPADFVTATVTSYAEQRLQSINQRIMSTTRLLDIIQRFDLYAELKDKWTTEEIIEKMRDDIQMETISADVVDRRTGRPTAATIAFTLSYEGKNPEKVQRVANMLASLFLEENIQVRARQTMETSEFIEEEMNKLKVDLNRIEGQLAAYKAENVNALPELLQVNMQSLHNIEASVERVQEQLRSYREREGYLEAQLATIPPETEERNADKRRLAELKTQIVYLMTRFSPEYPDVRKTQAEIAELEKRLGGQAGAGRNRANIPDNPAYITLSSQLASTRADIDSVKRQLVDLEKKAETYRARIEAAPKVEQEYKALMVERNNTQAKYDDLMRKLMEARVAHGLEKEQKGERFTLIDPARMPEKPFKPNRLAILAIGLVLAVGGGVGFAAVREFSDTAVHKPENLTLTTGFPVLATVPEIVTPQDLSRRRTRRVVAMLIMAAVLVAVVVAFNFLVMDLDVFWAKLGRKIAQL
jgi:polysaccharide chain length determinant protein (PEP-CTERM system associated)